MNLETGFIYVIGMPGIQAVKVGYATDIAARLSGLQTGSPFPMAVLLERKVSSAPAVEAALHQRFDSKRVRGEWFDLGPDAARIVGEACDEITADLPTSAFSAAAKKELGYDPFVLAPHELVWRDAGRWHDSLAEPPEYVTVRDLAGYIAEFTDDELWSKLSDYRKGWLIREAYAEDRVKAPANLRIQGDRVPVAMISSVWASLKRQAQHEPRLAPHCGIPMEVAEAMHAELMESIRERCEAEAFR